MGVLKLDGDEIEFEDGETVLQAARRAGHEIPTMCYQEGVAPQTSCLMCLVKVNGNPNLVPSCSRPAEENLEVENQSEEIKSFRKTVLDLMLSDHVGDCVSPCANVCPAHMEIPQMLRQTVAGDHLGALITVKRDIPFPGILGRVCPEICEGGCRRGNYEAPVSICLVKRFVADEDLATGDPYIPELAPPTGKKVAIIGSGPTGMTAAYYLMEMGHACTIYDKNTEAGGGLRTHCPEEQLPRHLLDQELDGLRRMGCDFKLGVHIGVDITMDEMRALHDAVFVATGPVKEGDFEKFGIEGKGIKPKVDKKTLETGVPGVFAGGGMIHRRNLAIRSVAAGKDAAMSIDQYLRGTKILGRPKRFNSVAGRLDHDTIDTMMESTVNKDDRYEPAAPAGTCFSKEEPAGLSTPEAQLESSRCLHCDCRAKDNCDLRDFSEEYDADQRRFTGARRPIGKIEEGDVVHLDNGKCIQCGLCIQIAEDHGEKIGLSYVGRGFQTRIEPPLGYNMSEALGESARPAAAACPTGALSMRDEDPTVKNPYDVDRLEMLGLTPEALAEYAKS